MSDIYDASKFLANSILSNGSSNSELCSKAKSLLEMIELEEKKEANNPLKIQQIAIGTRYPGELIENLKKIGLTEWAQDTVIAKGEVFGEEGENTAQLNFNYQLGFELEILKYLEGPNWHQARAPHDGVDFLSHMGLHVSAEEMINMKTKMKRLGIGIAQEVYTKSHTNPHIKGKRKYHYVVFDSRDQIGFDLKLIERIFI